MSTPIYDELAATYLAGLDWEPLEQPAPRLVLPAQADPSPPQHRLPETR
ncbi:hypothetical protein KCV87_11120 [Actinosynnema pretiosum subsp. pretiosum]|uniref:Uncharacterized protein n=1 Tax=Actinosynnema pretiosum subsp. pretiosum TaxID=103721 RepID=A0AA45LAY3_9PSEU|nr:MULTISPECIES: hypothetical protein [Actinosynnema]AXX29178.1 hypothetical protein APASM_1813 [Actinosynnema pretiosum subsp. pretiosum]QUF06551.1 hypothetical protein KCV87_11120 [Actinosynnema pretiosum subsp. pretiosum]